MKCFLHGMKVGSAIKEIDMLYQARLGMDPETFEVLWKRRSENLFNRIKKELGEAIDHGCVITALPEIDETINQCERALPNPWNSKTIWACIDKLYDLMW